MAKRMGNMQKQAELPKGRGRAVTFLTLPARHPFWDVRSFIPRAGSG